MTNQEINEKVARRLGWGKVGDGKGYEGWSLDCLYAHDKLPDYCTDISAAWEITSFSKEWRWMLNQYQDIWWCHVRSAEGRIEYVSFQSEADTAPMAICLAFLKLQ